MTRKAIGGHTVPELNGGRNTAENRTVKHGVSRLLPYVPPWIIWLGILAIAVVGYVLWGGSPVYPLGVMLAHQGAGVITWRLTKGLNDVLRLLALGSIMASALFCVLVGILGPTPVLISLWGGVGFTLCVYWGIRRMLLTAAKGTDEVSSGGHIGKLFEVLNGAKVGTPKVLEAGQVIVPLEANRGVQTQDDLRAVVQATESLTGLRPGAGRLVKSKTDAGKAEMQFIPKDTLAGVVPWRGPSAFGQSIALGVPLGLYADMEVCSVHLTGDEAVGRNASQWLVMGMTGAGKSKGLLMMFADIATRKDVTLWAHDHVKGLQTLRPILEGGGIDWVTMTKPDGKMMLEATRLVIQARARWMGAKGFDQWQEGCGLNVLCVWLEEANDLAQLKALLQLVREGRSVGVFIFISIQRASHTTIDTDSRAQLSGNICFGVDSATDAGFGLPDHVRDAGASPERWRAEKPGYAYVSAPGIDEDRQAIEIRFYLASKEEITDAVNRGRAVRTELDTVSVKAAGNVYSSRVPSAVYVTPNHPDYARAMGMSLNMTESDVLDNGVDSVSDSGDFVVGLDDDEKVSTTEAETIFASTVEMPECPAPGLGPVVSVSVQKLTTTQCRKMVQVYLAELYGANVFSIGVPDIIKMTPPIPRKREWIRAELNRLAGEVDGPAASVSAFRLHRDDDAPSGVYTIVAPQPVSVG